MSKREEHLRTVFYNTLLNFCEFFLEANEVLVQGPHESLVSSKGSLRHLLKDRTTSRERVVGAVPHHFIDELLEAEHHLAVRRYLFQHRPQAALRQKHTATIQSVFREQSHSHLPYRKITLL